jgi:uncharacterized protein YdcH (DUF465 family)
MMKRLWIGLLILILLVSGCSASNEQAASDYAMVESAGEPAMEAPMADRGDFGMDEADGNLAPSDQKLIRQGNMRVTVTDSIEAVQTIEDRVKDMGGYIAGSTTYSHNYDGQEYYSVDMDIRVPGESFKLLMSEIEDLGKVEHKGENVQDVTQQYIDLEARINNLKSEETRFVAIFDKADTVEDMLAVEREIARLRGDIESLEGQFRYLSNQVSYASLQVSLDEEHIKTAEFEGLSLGHVMKQMGSAFSRGVYGFFVFAGDLFVQLAYMLPFLIFLALVVFFIYLPVKRWRRKKSDKIFKGKNESSGSDKNEQA